MRKAKRKTPPRQLEKYQKLQLENSNENTTNILNTNNKL